MKFSEMGNYAPVSQFSTGVRAVQLARRGLETFSSLSGASKGESLSQHT